MWALLGLPWLDVEVDEKLVSFVDLCNGKQETPLSIRTQSRVLISTGWPPDRLNSMTLTMGNFNCDLSSQLTIKNKRLGHRHRITKQQYTTLFPFNGTRVVERPVVWHTKKTLTMKYFCRSAAAIKEEKCWNLKCRRTSRRRSSSLWRWTTTRAGTIVSPSSSHST